MVASTSSPSTPLTQPLPPPSTPLSLTQLPPPPHQHCLQLLCLQTLLSSNSIPCEVPNNYFVVLEGTEKIFKVLSYLIPGRFRDSEVLSELLYSTANLMGVVKDYLQEHKKYNQKQLVSLFLTAIECGEVCCEVLASRFWGYKRKWAVIVLIQLLKTCMRLTLIFKFKAYFEPHPPIIQSDEEMDEYPSGRCTTPMHRRYIQLNSGKKFPTIFSGVSSDEYDAGKVPCDPSRLHEERVLASCDILYALRPLVHLGALRMFGDEHWLQWLAPALMDAVSVFGVSCPENLSPDQRGELRRRALLLILYLLRSPCYNQVTRGRLEFILKFFADFIPGAAMICRPLLQYLQIWQKIYFYIWNN